MSQLVNNKDEETVFIGLYDDHDDGALRYAMLLEKQKEEKRVIEANDNLNNSSIIASEGYSPATKSGDENQVLTPLTDTDRENEKSVEEYSKVKQSQLSRTAEQRSITVAVSRLYRIVSQFSTSLLSMAPIGRDKSIVTEIPTQTSVPTALSQSKTKDTTDIEKHIDKMSSRTSLLSKEDEKNPEKQFTTKNGNNSTSLAANPTETTPTKSTNSIISIENTSLDPLSSPLPPSLAIAVEQDESSEVISPNDTIDSNKLPSRSLRSASAAPSALLSSFLRPSFLFHSKKMIADEDTESDEQSYFLQRGMFKTSLSSTGELSAEIMGTRRPQIVITATYPTSDGLGDGENYDDRGHSESRNSPNTFRQRVGSGGGNENESNQQTNNRRRLKVIGRNAYGDGEGGDDGDDDDERLVSSILKPHKTHKYLAKL